MITLIDYPIGRKVLNCDYADYAISPKFPKSWLRWLCWLCHLAKIEKIVITMIMLIMPSRQNWENCDYADYASPKVLSDYTAYIPPKFPKSWFRLLKSRKLWLLWLCYPPKIEYSSAVLFTTRNQHIWRKYPKKFRLRRYYPIIRKFTKLRFCWLRYSKIEMVITLITQNW